MTWQPTVNAKLGVVVHSYEGIKSYPFLSLKFGDTVQILEECGGWYRGFALKRRNKTGIFPASHIHVKECKVINKGPTEKVIPKEDPIIKEMTDVLRAWGDIWKKVYVEGSIQQYQELTKLMRDILDWRRQILSQTLPRDELKELKLRVAHKIDFGNKLMGLDVIPREEETGEVIDPRTASIVNLYRVIKKQSSLGIVESSGTINTTRTSTIFSSFKEPTQFHLFMKLEALVLAVRQETELLFSIYDAKANEVIRQVKSCGYQFQFVHTNIEQECDT